MAEERSQSNRRIGQCAQQTKSSLSRENRAPWKRPLPGEGAAEVKQRPRVTPGCRIRDRTAAPRSCGGPPTPQGGNSSRVPARDPPASERTGRPGRALCSKYSFEEDQIHHRNAQRILPQSPPGLGCKGHTQARPSPRAKKAPIRWRACTPDPKEPARADIGPAEKFLCKKRASVPHLL